MNMLNDIPPLPSGMGRRSSPLEGKGQWGRVCEDLSGSQREAGLKYSLCVVCAHAHCSKTRALGSSKQRCGGENGWQGQGLAREIEGVSGGRADQTLESRLCSEFFL